MIQDCYVHKSSKNSDWQVRRPVGRSVMKGERADNNNNTIRTAVFNKIILLQHTTVYTAFKFSLIMTERMNVSKMLTYSLCLLYGLDQGLTPPQHLFREATI